MAYYRACNWVTWEPLYDYHSRGNSQWLITKPGLLGNHYMTITAEEIATKHSVDQTKVYYKNTTGILLESHYNAYYIVHPNWARLITVSIATIVDLAVQVY